MIIIQASMTAKPGQRDRAVSAFKQAMEGSITEPGCNTYRYTVDLYDSNKFHIIELWDDEASLLGHLQGEPFKNFIAAMPELLDPIGMDAYKGALEPYSFPIA